MVFSPVSQSCALPRAEPRYGGTFTWGVYHKPDVFNPILTTQTVSATLIQLIFSGLVRINSFGEPEPDLASSWDMSDDGRTYTFHLRRGIRFHDGNECTAEDVKFTYDLMMDAKIDSPFRESFEIVERFEAIDKYTFKVTLKEPSVSFIYRMVRYIVPKHLLEGKDLHNSDFNFHPIGTGPFKFRDWTKDDQIILEHNPDYYEGRPYLDRIVVKTYLNSEDVWAALMREEIDCAEFIGQKDYEIVKKDPTFKAYAVAVDSYFALIYNLNDPILFDKKVRQAIAYAVDRKSLIVRVASGYGVECTGPFYPGTLGFNPDVVPFEYNPEKAQAILSESGWEDRDGDGILEKDGEKLELNVLVDERNKVYEKIIMVLRQQLQEVGIRINVILYDNDGMLAKEFLDHKKASAHLSFLFAGMDPDQEAEDWSIEGAERSDKLWIYRSEEMSELFALGRITQDKEQRRKIYQKIHRFIYEDQPACFLYFPFLFHAVSRRIGNTDEYFNVNMPNYAIKDFYIADAQ